ncbi:MAG TPA: hypothetical protein VN728_03030 [Stellaceae bacterium]|jgi:hypothetical protein|nr:hypothetical protein [Stellaceae bacterium]
MQVAPTTAIIDAIPLLPAVPAVREVEAAARQRAKHWAAPSTIGRGQLIDLVV